jgi:TetR/AcrR family transcriptional regulator, copper-responsive repressor
MEQNSSKQRGRPRTYNRKEVVGRAMRLFWNVGADAPIDEVSRATGLHKPSLYAAFGGKRGLYIEALDSYIDQSRAQMSGALALDPLPRALETFFKVDLDIFCRTEGRRGCFLISTAVDAAADDPDVRERVERVFAGMRSTILARIERAVAAGDLSSAVDSSTIADLVTSTHVSLSVEARAGTSREELEDKVRRVLDLIGSYGAK